MERNLLVAGFGGQGVMLLGKLLSYATCESTEKQVTFFLFIYGVIHAIFSHSWSIRQNCLI